MKKYEQILKDLTTAQREEFAIYLAALPEQYQTAIKDAMAGKIQDETAAALGCSRVWVSRMVSRGLRSIFKLMKIRAFYE